MNASPTYHFCTFKTPAGPFTIAVDEEGGVVAAAFGGRERLSGRIRSANLREDEGRTGAARGQVEAWFGGKRREFTLHLAPEGSPFQKRVWAALREIPYGETRSYKDIAAAVGSSARAVGRANATNPVCVIVPCHRVIGADGSLTGYAFGEETKRRLLDLERS
jgi:methylated-DNA-[protein]-cysteine S-methyltransferase